MCVLELIISTELINTVKEFKLFNKFIDIELVIT